jgi:Holliday junction resolvase
MAKDGPVPFLLRDGSEKERKKDKTNRRKPKAQERKVAAAVGGKRQPGSGAFEAKGDVRSAGEFPMVIECKRTSGQKSIRVEAEWLAKVTREAHAQGSYPGLSIEFDDEVMSGFPGKPEATWMALPLTVFQELLERAGG